MAKKQKRARSAPEAPAHAAIAGPKTTSEPAKTVDAPPSATAETAEPTSLRSSTASERRSVIGARLAIVLAALAAFVGVLDNGVLSNWDDERFLRDPDVVHPSPAAFWHLFTEIRFEAYHPLHRLSYWIDVPWVGAEGAFAASVIHGVSLALWILVLLIAFEVLRRLDFSPVAACVATLAFGIHPLAVEVVAWASCRKDILALGFSLAAVLAHLRTSMPSRPWHDRAAWLSRVLYLCAALSKTSVLPLPLALIAVDLWMGRRKPKDAVLYQTPALLLGLALAAVVIWVWVTNNMIQSAGTDAEPFDWALVPATVHHILEACLFPIRLAAMYPLLRYQPVPLWKGLLAILLLAGAIAMAYRGRGTKTGRRVGFGLTWAVIFMLPVLNLIPMFMQWQDRYCVTPLFGLALGLGAIVDALGLDALERGSTRPARLVPPLALAAVVLLPLGWLTTIQVETWQDGAHLWGNATRRYPRAHHAWMRLGESRRARRDYGGALRAYVHAIDIAPEMRMAHAGFLHCLGLRDEMREDLSPSRALLFAERFARDADDPDVLRSLAGEMVEAGYRDAATYVLARSLDLDPVSDERIESAISFHLGQRSIWLARFYLSRLHRRPVLRDVSAFWDAERERLGMISDEEMERRREGGAPERDEGGPVVIPIGD